MNIFEPPTDPTAERAEVLRVFTNLLATVTGDGSKKRMAGTKPSWKVDPSHLAAIFSHLNKWFHGERVDKDSGAHPFVHLAWRALAIAWQETQIAPVRLATASTQPNRDEVPGDRVDKLQAIADAEAEGLRGALAGWPGDGSGLDDLADHNANEADDYRNE